MEKQIIKVSPKTVAQFYECDFRTRIAREKSLRRKGLKMLLEQEIQ